MRLGSVSRMWFEGLEENVDDWEDFKRRMIRAFPSRTDEVDIHNVLMKRVKQFNESYESFVYDVVAKAWMVNLGDAAIVKYVINGIPNSQLRLVLSTAGYTSVDTLLEAILRHENQNQMLTVRNEHFSNDSQDHMRSKMYVRRCFNCGARGHFARMCFRNDGRQFQRGTGEGSFRQSYIKDANSEERSGGQQYARRDEHQQTDGRLMEKRSMN